MDILEQIINDTTKRCKGTWKNFHADEAFTSSREKEGARVPLVPSILEKSSDEPLFLIAEVKQASPSRGIIVPDFDHLAIAQHYQESGVHAISVLTEETFFKGSIAHLRDIRSAIPALPLLRKDFIVHPYQVHEAYEAGADMVLLIVAVLSDDMLRFLYDYIVDFGMTPLVEVHSEEEIARALAINPVLMGINNRNLKTFEVDIQHTIILKTHIPEHIKVISESGITNELDVALLRSCGVSGILVGQSLLESDSRSSLIDSMIT